MEQTLPVEELANQRLSVLVYSYTLLVKNLLEEGVALEKVKSASDKAWSILGQQAAAQLKPILGETINLEAIHQSGAIAENVHGMQVNEKMSENEIQTEFIKCPWQEAYNALDMPTDWRICPSGHLAFTQSMYQGLNQNASYELTSSMPAGDQVCKGISSL